MIAPDNHDWKPDPQLLAAFFDGELEGRDDLADLRTRIEAWLEHHPDAAADGATQQQLGKLWLDTTPKEPSVAAWNQVLEAIDSQRRRPMVRSTSRRPWLTAGLVAACITLVIGLGFGAKHFSRSNKLQDEPVVKAPGGKTNSAENVEVFPVATTGEVVVTLIEGADTGALVVGELPVRGPLVLAERGDVRVFAIHSEASNRLLPQAPNDGPSRPMIWMPLDTDD